MSEIAPNSVFVGGLSYSIDDERLREIFEEAGSVRNCRVFMSAGRSKGIGTVEFDDEEGYKKALEMNDKEYNGRRIFVRENREPPARSTDRGERGERRYGDREDRRGDGERVGYGDRRGGDRREGRERPMRESRDVAGLQLFVSGLQSGTNWRDVKDYFTSQYKAPGYVEVKDKFRESGPLNAVVRYDNREDAQEAVERINGSDFNGNKIIVKLDERV